MLSFVVPAVTSSVTVLPSGDLVGSSPRSFWHVPRSQLSLAAPRVDTIPTNGACPAAVTSSVDDGIQWFVSSLQGSVMRYYRDRDSFNTGADARAIVQLDAPPDALIAIEDYLVAVTASHSTVKVWQHAISRVENDLVCSAHLLGSFTVEEAAMAKNVEWKVFSDKHDRDCTYICWLIQHQSRATFVGMATVTPSAGVAKTHSVAFSTFPSKGLLWDATVDRGGVFRALLLGNTANSHAIAVGLVQNAAPESGQIKVGTTERVESLAWCEGAKDGCFVASVRDLNTAKVNLLPVNHSEIVPLTAPALCSFQSESAVSAFGASNELAVLGSSLSVHLLWLKAPATKKRADMGDTLLDELLAAPPQGASPLEKTASASPNDIAQRVASRGVGGMEEPLCRDAMMWHTEDNHAVLSLLFGAKLTMASVEAATAYVEQSWGIDLRTVLTICSTMTSVHKIGASEDVDLPTDALKNCNALLKAAAPKIDLAATSLQTATRSLRRLSDAGIVAVFRLLTATLLVALNDSAIDHVAFGCSLTLGIRSTFAAQVKRLCPVTVKKSLTLASRFADEMDKRSFNQGKAAARNGKRCTATKEPAVVSSFEYRLETGSRGAELQVRNLEW